MKKQSMIILTILLLIISTLSTISENQFTKESIKTGFLEKDSFLFNLFQQIIKRIQSTQIYERISDLLTLKNDNEFKNKPSTEPMDDRTGKLDLFMDDNIDDNQWIYPGENINYSITYENGECCQYTNVIIKDYIPNGVIVMDASHPYAINNNVFNWNLGTIEPNEREDRWILVSVSSSTEPGSTIINLAKIFVGTEEHDAVSTQTNIGSPSIHLQKSDGINNTDYVNPTDIINYNITYENPTGFTYTDVVMRDDLPEHFSFINSSHPCNQPNGFVHWNIETINPYQSETIWLNVSVDEDAPVGVQKTNIVYLNYSLGSTSGYIEATETTLIGPPSYIPLEITKEDNCINDAIPPQGVVNYTITMKNPNLVNVYDVWVTDYLPDEVIFLDACQENFVEYYEHIADWYYPMLGPNETRTIWLKVQAKDTIDAGESFQNEIKIDSEQTDPSYTTETTIINEIFPPETSIFIGEPSVDNKWVTTNTLISLHATDNTNENQSGVSYIYYEIEWDGAQFDHKVFDNSDEDKNSTQGIVEAYIYFEEPCIHHLSFYSVDKTGTIESPHNHTFYVDNSPPDISDHYSGIADHYFYKNGDTWYTGIARSTLVNLIASGSGSNSDNGCNGGVGFDHLQYRWYAGEEIDDLEKIVDSSSNSPYVSLDLFMSLWHRIEYYAEDELGNKNPGNESYKSIDLLIDDQGPITTSYYDGLFYEDEDGIDWITSNTKKIIDATDSGGIPGGSGVNRIEWHIDQRLRGEWSTVQEGIVFDNDLNDTDGTPAKPNQGNSGGLYAYDYKGEPFVYQDTIVKNWSYDPGEPILDLDPDDDGFIQAYVAEPGKYYPDIVDEGGLWAMDEHNEPYIFQDFNETWQYDGNDTILNIDPDNDCIIDGEMIPKYRAQPQFGDHAGLYAKDDDQELFIFKDTSENTAWTFDKWWNEETTSWIHEPIVSLKPDYDGMGTIQMNLTIPEDGEHRFYYKAFDRFGNAGSEHNQYVKVDNTPPDTSIHTGEPHCSYYDVALKDTVICASTDTRITFHSEDQIPPSDVGIDTLHYFIKENNIILEQGEIPQDEYYFTFDSFGQGFYNVSWFATDLLGNTEPIHYQPYCIDNTPPTVEINIETPKVMGLHHEPDYWITSDTNVTVEVFQTGCCPILDTRFRVNKGSWHELTESSAQIPSSFFEPEKRYEIEIEAYNCYLPPVITRKVVYVDDSPPEMSVMNPSEGGYYAEGDLISTMVYAEDLPLHPPLAEPVGISQGSAGNAVLIDIFPDFTLLPLSNVDFIFDPENEGSPFFQGDFKIVGSEENLNDGPVLFVVEIEDDLGNSQNSILNTLYDYFEDADGDENIFKSLINNDDGINNKVVWLIIDNSGNEDDDDVPIGTVESISFISPESSNDFEDDDVDIMLEITGDADPNNVDVEVTVSLPGYHDFVEIASYNGEDMEYQILDYDLSFLKNNSLVEFHATATDAQGTIVETTTDPTVIINNTVYFSTFLESGWNTIEFEEIKGDNDVETVFASILENNDVTVIFEEESGNYYIPGQSFNLLESVSTDTIYKIKMKEDVPLYLDED